MEGARVRARSLVEELTSAWLAGDHEAIASACTPDVHWWTPLGEEDVSGPTATAAVLRQVLEPLPRPVEVTAVVPSDDGTRCVVELRSAATPPAFVTSVMSIHDGQISAGRTYTDLPGHGRHPDPEAS